MEPIWHISRFANSLIFQTDQKDLHMHHHGVFCEKSNMCHITVETMNETRTYLSLLKPRADTRHSSGTVWIRLIEFKEEHPLLVYG